MGGPLLGTARLHVGHCPHYFGLFVQELGWAEPDVGLA